MSGDAQSDSAKSSPGATKRTLPPLKLPALPDLSDMAALQNFRVETEKEKQKLKLSRMCEFSVERLNSTKLQPMTPRRNCRQAGSWQSLIDTCPPTLSLHIAFFRDAIRVQGSCLPRIMPSVLGVTLWATLIYCADHYFGRKWKTSSAIVGPLSVVVGLLLVFRNSTSYDRWYEARKLWAQATADARSLGRYLWANVDIAAGLPSTEGANPGASASGVRSAQTDTPSNTYSSKATKFDTARSTLPPGDPSASVSSDGGSEAFTKRLEKKKRAIRLLVLYLQALAHELRGEPGVDWPTYDGILPDDMKSMWHGAQTASARNEEEWERYKARLGAGATRQGYVNDTLRSLPPEAVAEAAAERNGHRDADVEAGWNREPTATLSTSPSSSAAAWLRKANNSASKRKETDETTALLSSTTTFRGESDRGNARISPGNSPPAMGLPLFALHELSRYIASARKYGLLQDIGPAGFSLANTQLAALTGAHGSLNRIAHCTIPVTYGIHLKQCTLFYLLALPLTLVTELGWKMVPFVTLVAVTLLGLEGISSEVEVPFGDDGSDHNLELFCAEFKHEMEHMMVFLPEGTDPGLCL